MQFSRTRFIMCISPQLGGSGDPSNLTALGVKVAMESALDATAKSALAGKTVAIQVVVHCFVFQPTTNVGCRVWVRWAALWSHIS